MIKRLILCYLLFMPIFFACSGKEIKDEKPAQELAAEGMAQFKKGKYKSSILTFEKLKDWYPFSKLASLAELKVADAYYQIKEYESAIAAYQEFENLHPRNEAIPYVIYQIGRCWFDQMDTIDRDHTYAQNALQAFLRLSRQYPDDPYTLRAREHIDQCRKNLAEYEFYVGMFYFKSKQYMAAKHRFTAVLTDYPDVGVQQRALHYVTLCDEKIRQQETASE
jgi:outer membrane protein assembly factor BamD